MSGSDGFDTVSIGGLKVRGISSPIFVALTRKINVDQLQIRSPIKNLALWTRPVGRAMAICLVSLAAPFLTSVFNVSDPLEDVRSNRESYSHSVVTQGKVEPCILQASLWHWFASA